MCACSAACHLAGRPISPTHTEALPAGEHELKLWEAVELVEREPGSVECQDGDGNWTKFTPAFPWRASTVILCGKWQFRRKPKPVVVPRCRELAREAADAVTDIKHTRAEVLEPLFEKAIRKYGTRLLQLCDAATADALQVVLEQTEREYLGSPAQGRAGR